MKETFAQFFGLVMTISFMFCYVPQIVTIYKNKFSRGLSLGLILMSICGYISGMVYMFLTQFGIWWFANYSVGLIMCIVLVYAWFKFRKNQFFKIYALLAQRYSKSFTRTRSGVRSSHRAPFSGVQLIWQSRTFARSRQQVRALSPPKC